MYLKNSQLLVKKEFLNNYKMFPKDSVMLYAKKGGRVANSFGHNKEKTVNRTYFLILTNHNLAISEMQF